MHTTSKPPCPGYGLSRCNVSANQHTAAVEAIADPTGARAEAADATTLEKIAAVDPQAEPVSP
jgi:hypothetical protein